MESKTIFNGVCRKEKLELKERATVSVDDSLDATKVAGGRHSNNAICPDELDTHSTSPDENKTVEILRNSIPLNYKYVQPIKFNKNGVAEVDKTNEVFWDSVKKACLALEKSKLVWVLFCEEDCEGGIILGIYRDYETGKKELERLAEKEGGVIKDNSYRVGVSVTSLSSYPVF